MNAQVEEAVLHESEGIPKWGWFGGRRGFYSQPGLVAQVELGFLGGTWPLSHQRPYFSSSCQKSRRLAPRRPLRDSKRLNRLVCLIASNVTLANPPSKILDDYGRKMRDAENESHEGKRKSESLWPIMRISHARSRYIYELYYKREAISKELYDWLLKEKYADAK